MEISRKSCRICLNESEFNASLFGSYSRRTNMIDKILVCLKIVIEETDVLDTICYKCAEKIESYYNFIMFVKKSQTKLAKPRPVEALNRRMTSYVREQVIDADFTFSFLDIEEKKEPKPTNVPSSPFFSYFSPPAMKSEEHVWKTPRTLQKEEIRKGNNMKRPCKPESSRHLSRDLFESQSQDVDEEQRSLDWKLTPDDNILKRVRNKCFGRSDY